VRTTLQDLRIAVTGAGGFLGPYVADALARQRARVHAVVGAPGETVRTPALAASVARADVCDVASVRQALAGARMVVHLAGPASVAGSFREPTRYLRIHAEGTAAVLEACRAEGIDSIVYVSSAEVYGRPLRLPVDEDHPLSARSPYAAAKIAGEKLIEAETHLRSLRAVVLRPFSIYGPGASPDSLVGRITALASARRPIALRDLRPVRDYCFVEDLAEAVAAACRADRIGFSVFNVGTGRGTSVAQVAATALEVLGLDLPIVETGDRDRPGDSEILELVADNRRAREMLAFCPAVSLAEGLRKTLLAAGP
jgi:UDP-glucose 4-epimerase